MDWDIFPSFCGSSTRNWIIKKRNNSDPITSSIFSTPVDILFQFTFATLKVYVFLFLSSISLTTSESFPLPLHEITNSFNGMYFTLLTQSEWTWPRVWHVTKREWLDRSYRKKSQLTLINSKESKSSKNWPERTCAWTSCHCQNS